MQALQHVIRLVTYRCQEHRHLIVNFRNIVQAHVAIGDLHGEWWVAVAQFDTGPFLMYVGSWQGAQVQGNLYRIRTRDVGRRVRGEAWGGLHKNATLWGLRRDIVLRLHRGSWEWRRRAYPHKCWCAGRAEGWDVLHNGILIRR